MIRKTVLNTVENCAFRDQPVGAFSQMSDDSCLSSNEPAHEILVLRPKRHLCMFQVSRPYLGFCPDPKHFIANFKQNSVKYAENGRKCSGKCNFYIKYLINKMIMPTDHA